MYDPIILYFAVIMLHKLSYPSLDVDNLVVDQ